MMCASQQFRTRDCKRMDLFLYSATHPAIESCHNLRFGCFTANYTELRSIASSIISREWLIDSFCRSIQTGESQHLQQQLVPCVRLFRRWRWKTLDYYSICNIPWLKFWITFYLQNYKLKEAFQAILSNNIPIDLSFDLNRSLVPNTEPISSLDPYPQCGDLSGDQREANQKSFLVFIYDTGQLDPLEAVAEKLLKHVQVRFAVSWNYHGQTLITCLQDMKLLFTRSYSNDKAGDLLKKLAEIDQMKDNSGVEPSCVIVLMFRSNCVYHDM